MTGLGWYGSSYATEATSHCVVFGAVAKMFPEPSLCECTICEQLWEDSRAFVVRNNTFVRSNRDGLIHELPGSPHPATWMKDTPTVRLHNSNITADLR